jgi:hypothetical protein
MRRNQAKSFDVMLAMEGKRELPPLLRAGFQHTPLAAEGWRAMTATQRRSHQLGIFNVQTVDGRERPGGEGRGRCSASGRTAARERFSKL